MANNTTFPTDDTARAFCFNCAYPLDPLDRPTGQCPECGHPFDLADPATFSPAPNHRRLRRIAQNVRRRLALIYEAYLRTAAKPTPWLGPAALAVYATSVVVSVLLLGELLWPIFSLFAGLCAIGLAFTPRRLARRDLGAMGKYPTDAVKADRAVLVRIRNASLWLILILLLRLPFYLSFLINLVALDGVAHRVDTDPGALKMNHIGLLPVRRQLVGHGGAEFQLPGGRSLFYRPSWESDYFDDHIRHVWGAWFVCDLPIHPRFPSGETAHEDLW